MAANYARRAVVVLAVVFVMVSGNCKDEQNRATESIRIRRTQVEKLPGTKSLWTFEGDAIPIELNWPKRDEMVFRLGDPVGASLLGFEIIAFRKLELPTKSVSEIDSEQAKMQCSPNGALVATILAEYSFTFDRSGKRVDTSSFQLRCRSTDDKEWHDVTKLAGEPQSLSVSTEGTHIGFVVGGRATIVNTKGDTVGEIDAVQKVFFGADWRSLYLLREKDQTMTITHYDLAEKREQTLLQDDDITDLDVSATGKHIAYTRKVGDRQDVCVFDTAANALVCSPVANLRVPSLAFSPDGKYLAFVTDRTIVRLNPEDLLKSVSEWK